jgi:hypothetical protein
MANTDPNHPWRKDLERGRNVNARRLQRAHARRLELQRQERASYALTVRADRPCIVCLCCEMTSFNPNDIAALYCVHCAAFHEDPILLREASQESP